MAGTEPSAELHELLQAQLAIDAGKEAIVNGLDPEKAANVICERHQMVIDLAIVGIANLGPSATREVVAAMKKQLGRSTNA